MIARKLSVALLICALPTVSANAAVLFAETFDTDTADLADTLFVYGLTSTGLDAASVSSGSVQINTIGANGSLDIGAFAGDITVTTLVTTTGCAAGSVNAGLRVGNNNFIFHPGFGGGAFRIDGPGGHGNLDMGFTPDRDSFSSLSLSINAGTGQIDITIVDGLDATLTYFETFVDTDYIGGMTMIGLSTGSTLDVTGVFDSVTIETTPVPLPSPILFLSVGTVALGSLVRQKNT